jgi:hypothetical protein
MSALARKPKVRLTFARRCRAFRTSYPTGAPTLMLIRPPPNQAGIAMTDAQRRLHQALKAYKFDLEIKREDLADQIEAARLVLEGLEQALEPQAQPERSRWRQ